MKLTDPRIPVALLVLVFLVAFIKMGLPTRPDFLTDLGKCLGAGFIGYRIGRDAERRRARPIQ